MRDIPKVHGLCRRRTALCTCTTRRPERRSSVPALANGVVYAGSIAHGLQAIDEASGDVLYSADGICWSPIVSHGEIYAACNEMTVFGL